jgi:hypothetical protein
MDKPEQATSEKINPYASPAPTGDQTKRINKLGLLLALLYLGLVLIGLPAAIFLFAAAIPKYLLGTKMGPWPYLISLFAIAAAIQWYSAARARKKKP